MMDSPAIALAMCTDHDRRESFDSPPRNTNLSGPLPPPPNSYRTPTEKVLEKRDADIEGAWARFVAAATEHGAGLKRRSDARRAHPHPVSLDKRAGASGIHDHEKKFLVLMKRYTTRRYRTTGVRTSAAVFSFARGGGGGLCARRS